MDFFKIKGRPSTWMILVSVLIMAMIVQPRLLSFILLAANAGWMFLTREVVRAEGGLRSVCRPCVIGGGVVLIASCLVVFKINWLAI